MTTDERIEHLTSTLITFQLEMTRQIAALSEQVKTAISRADAADLVKERFDSRLTSIEHQIWKWSGVATASGAVGGVLLARLLGV
jgi:hypothetical protein